VGCFFIKRALFFIYADLLPAVSILLGSPGLFFSAEEDLPLSSFFFFSFCGGLSYFSLFLLGFGVFPFGAPVFSLTRISNPFLPAGLPFHVRPLSVPDRNPP